MHEHPAIINVHPLIVFLVFGILQAIFYLLCIRNKWKYVDFAVLAFALFCNSWLLPKLLMMPDADDGCAWAYNGMTQGVCYLLGNGISVFLFVGYALLRRAREKKTPG